jgi:hypothetical protein
MLNLARALDIHLDEEGQTNIDRVLNNLIEGRKINHMTASECDEFRRIYEKLPTERQAVIRQATDITAYAERLKNASVMGHLIAVRAQEAELFGTIVSLPEDVTAVDNAARQRFNTWLLSFSRAGYMIDSTVDHWDDFANGTVSIKPSLATSLALGKEIVKELKTCYAELPKRAVPGMFKDGLTKAARLALKSRKNVPVVTQDNAYV